MHADFRADLHTHTNCSDGSDDPIALLHLAKEKGLSGLSITDHDTVNAYTPELFAEAERIGLRLLTGIEISSELDKTSVHILGYGFDPKAPTLQLFLKEMQKRRAERNRAILEKLAQRKMPISEQELLDFAYQANAKRTIGRPHIAQLMVQKKYVGSTQQAFELYLREGGLCYTFGVKFTPKEAIEQIHLAKGKAILAHPHFIKSGSFKRKLFDNPFDGIECYYGNLPKELELPWIRLAKEKNWIATGGSDYHGPLKPHISLGASWVGESTLEMLLAH